MLGGGLFCIRPSLRSCSTQPPSEPPQGWPVRYAQAQAQKHCSHPHTDQPRPREKKQGGKGATTWKTPRKPSAREATLAYLLFSQTGAPLLQTLAVSQTKPATNNQTKASTRRARRTALHPFHPKASLDPHPTSVISGHGEGAGRSAERVHCTEGGSNLPPGHAHLLQLVSLTPAVRQCPMEHTATLTPLGCSAGTGAQVPGIQVTAGPQGTQPNTQDSLQVGPMPS